MNISKLLYKSLISPFLENFTTNERVKRSEIWVALIVQAVINLIFYYLLPHNKNDISEIYLNTLPLDLLIVLVSLYAIKNNYNKINRKFTCLLSFFILFALLFFTEKYEPSYSIFASYGYMFDAFNDYFEALKQFHKSNQIRYCVFILSMNFVYFAGIFQWIRRLKDCNRSPWFLLLLPTIIGTPVVLYFVLFEKSSDEDL